MKELAKWPDPNDYCEGTDSMYEESQQCLRYERALRIAYEERLRVAVEALRDIAAPQIVPAPGASAMRRIKAEQAIATIGPLPPKDAP